MESTEGTMASSGASARQCSPAAAAAEARAAAAAGGEASVSEKDSTIAPVEADSATVGGANVTTATASTENNKENGTSTGTDTDDNDDTAAAAAGGSPAAAAGGSTAAAAGGSTAAATGGSTAAAAGRSNNDFGAASPSAAITSLGSSLLEDFAETARGAALGRSLTTPLQRFGSIIAKPFAPQVTMDGTKLIIKLARHDKFQFDSPCRMLLATPRIKMEHCNVWTTQATCQDNENTIVLDSGGIGQRFVPVPLSHYGTVYTREGTVHVVVGGDVRRSKVHSRHLPYKTCNKFQARFVDDSEDEQLTQSREESRRQLGSLSPGKAIKMIKHLASDPHGGVVYVRGDESLVRYKLKHDERVEIQSGQIVAWTLGVRFEYRSVCCFRYVSAILGDGTVWICNPRAK